MWVAQLDLCGIRFASWAKLHVRDQFRHKFPWTFAWLRGLFYVAINCSFDNEITFIGGYIIALIVSFWVFNFIFETSNHKTEHLH